MKQLCQRCGEDRSRHNPPEWYIYAKSGFSNGGGRKVKIKARTCNDNLICGCWEFIPLGSCTCLFLFNLEQHLSPTCPFNKKSLPGSHATTAHAGSTKKPGRQTPRLLPEEKSP